MSTPPIAWPKLTAELRRFVARRLDADVDDVVQDALLKIHRNLPELRDEERLGPWAYRIARNAIVDHVRRGARRPPPIASTDELHDDAAEIAETVNLNAEVASWLRPMIEQLEAPYREALLLTEVEGLSQVALAKRLGLSKSGARTRVQRARQKLRAIVAQCCALTTDTRGNVIAVDGRDDACC